MRSFGVPLRTSSLLLLAVATALGFAALRLSWHHFLDNYETAQNSDVHQIDLAGGDIPNDAEGADEPRLVFLAWKGGEQTLMDA